VIWKVFGRIRPTIRDASLCLLPGKQRTGTSTSPPASTWEATASHSSSSSLPSVSLSPSSKINFHHHFPPFPSSWLIEQFSSQSNFLHVGNYGVSGTRSTRNWFSRTSCQTHFGLSPTLPPTTRLVKGGGIDIDWFQLSLNYSLRVPLRPIPVMSPVSPSFSSTTPILPTSLWCLSKVTLIYPTTIWFIFDSICF